MKAFLLIIAIVLVMLYIFMPYDLLPDIFPVAGWLDDTALLALLFYYLRYKKLPNFIGRVMQNLFGTRPSQNRHYQQQGQSAGSQQQGSYRDSGRQQTGALDPYAVLGLKPGASKEEIHAAYRKLAHQYHPDKVSHLGEEFQDMARQKFVEIQEAYEKLTGKQP
ncbi:MAG: DnaJ domain-containing protein [Thermodesulfobacteriota bacterium]